MDWGNAFVRDKKLSASGVVESIQMELHVEGDFKKTKKKVTWLAASSPANTLTPVTLVDYDYLITKKKLEEDDSVEQFVTPVTEFREDATADGNVLASVKKGDTVQFERKGYYICDSVGDGFNGRWEFILIPDGRAVSIESKAVAAKKAEEKAKNPAGAAAPKKEKKVKKEKKAGGAKAAAAPAELSATKTQLSYGSSGFEIPVSTVVSP